jgi:hypothetical protein
MSGIPGVGLALRVLGRTEIFAEKFIQTLKTQEQTFRVLYFFENAIALITEQAKRLGIERLTGRLRCAQGVLGSATSCLVVTKMPGSLWALKESFLHFQHKGKESEGEIEKLSYDVATAVEDAAYVGLLLNTTMLVQLASKTLNSLLFVANAAALYYDVVDLKNAIYRGGAAVVTGEVDQNLSESEKNHLEEIKLLEVVKIAKTVLHISIDILGILAAAFGVTLLSTTTTVGIVCIYLIGSMWTHVYGQVISDEEKAARG